MDRVLGNKPPLLERDLETFFSAECKRLGLTTLKLMLRFATGWPDRIVMLPDGKVLWVELKTEKGVVSPRQAQIHLTLSKIGHPVLVLRTKTSIREVLEGLKNVD